ncbi:MAG: phosphoenolpyruvate-utilizing N-terminal domain-containing protein, partial [Elusimicrobiota bacterium]|nr:phosphoenolpyruvate-utilizing N-terminal domain-containing protein [Elusimicrobiota bacterium]
MKTREKNKEEIRLKGTIISPGIGWGKAQILDQEIAVIKVKILPDQVEKEKQRYSRAIDIVHERLDEHVKESHFGSSLSVSQILKVHKAMLEDNG